jgi:HAD superfamily hydrolase (TIGR01509 family)
MSTPARPEVWLFDFDGTLARLEPVVNWPEVRVKVRAMLARAGAPASVTELVPPRALGMYDAYRAHLEGADAAARKRRLAVLARASKLIEKYELADVDRAAPLVGALELLGALSAAGLRSGIVTSNSSRTVARWLRRHRMDSAVEVTIGRDSGLALKPDPAAVLRALELFGAVPPRAAVLVGDSEVDVHAARAAGVHFVGIAENPDAADRLVAAGADEVYASPAALAIHRGLIATRLPRSRARAPKPDAAPAQ